MHARAACNRRHARAVPCCVPRQLISAREEAARARQRDGLAKAQAKVRAERQAMLAAERAAIGRMDGAFESADR